MEEGGGEVGGCKKWEGGFKKINTANVLFHEHQRVYVCVSARVCVCVCVCVCECVSKQTNEGRRARCVGASHWKPEGPGANVSVLGTKSDRPTTFTNKYNKNQHTGSVKLQDSGWHWLVIGRHSPGAR